MPSAHEVLSDQFHRWEERGRGWQTFGHPVRPEPPFIPFYYSDPPAAEDDGRRATILSSFIQRLSQKLSESTPPPVVESETNLLPEPFERGSLVELQLSLPPGYNPESFEPFLHSVTLCRGPLSFELLGLPAGIVTQLALEESDAPRVRKQIQGNFPEVAVHCERAVLESAWTECEDGEAAIVEFGLRREFMRMLNAGHLDPFVSFAAAMAELQTGELGLFQVLFQPVREPWRDSILRAVLDTDGKPLFVNAPELTKQTAEKVSQPLYGAVVRIAARAADFDRAWEIVCDLASALRVFARPDGNELIPLRNDTYPFDAHLHDVVHRQCRRSGMLLNIEELLGFVHLPSPEVPYLRRASAKTKTAPVLSEGLLLGENIHQGRTTEVRLSADQRVRHCHIIGASGTGKSTLLFNMIRQDIENGGGVALLDPHGDLVDKLLGIVPPNRIEDVILIDPSDEQYSVGFNILSAHSELEKNILASDLVSVFQRLSSSWGDQMGSVLRNAIGAFLESSRGGTLSQLRRFLLEPEFRNEFLKTVGDPEIVYYWRKAFPQLAGNKSIGPILTRLETFLGPKPIRYLVSQRQNRLDFAEIMDSGKIFLAKLSQGLIGKENSYLLGSLLLSKFHQVAMSRQAQAVRRDYWLYADEFQNFITPSMAEILAGTRKYRLGLVLAHQELRQLERDRDVAGAVFNCCTRVVFRVSDEDARKLSEGFASFEARDLQNLDTGHAICRIERSDRDFNLKVTLPKELDPAQTTRSRREIITASREKYATPTATIEAELVREVQHESEQTSTQAHTEPPKAKKESGSGSLSIGPISDFSKLVPEPPKPQHQKEAETPKVALPTPDMGRGGAQHQAIQQRLKEAAEHLGFHATIEKQILSGLGSVDLLLERPPDMLACEISITTTIDHEVGNVAKCLKAGFDRVIVISTEERLEKIRSAVINSLNPTPSNAVSYFLPDQFITWLESIPLPKSERAATGKRRRGRPITRSVAKLSPEERNAREAETHCLVAESMKRIAQ